MPTSPPPLAGKPDSSESIGTALESLRPSLHRVLRHHRIPPDDAQDLVQRCFLQVLPIWDRIQSKEAYTVTALRFLCIDYWTRRHAERVDFLDPALLLRLSPSEAPTQELPQLVKSLLLQLPNPHHRTVLLLRLAYGFTAQQIAERLGISANYVRKLITRSRSLLLRFSAPPPTLPAPNLAPRGESPAAKSSPSAARSAKSRLRSQEARPSIDRL